jgi:hypothetical protein
VAISFVGSAGGINSVTMPTHQAGDLIIAFAYRDGNTTAPSLPVGWSNPDVVGAGVTNSGNTQSARIGYKFAASSSETSGTWTNATGLVIHVYRGVSQRSPFQLATWVNAASSLSMTYGPLDAIIRNDSTTWVVAFAGHRSQNAAVNTAPSGLTNRTDYSDATNHVAGHDTNAATNTASTYSNTVSGTANGYITCVLDLIEDYTASGTNLCTNGTLDTNTTGWTLDAFWSRQTDQASPCLGSTGAGQYATWTGGISATTVYEVSWTSFVSNGQVNLVNANFGGINNPSPTDTGRTIRRLLRTGATANIQFQGGSGYRIDNIEMRTISAASTADALGDPPDISSASTVGTPTIGQIHAITATAPTIASTVGTPTIGQVHALGDPADISSTSHVGTPSMAPSVGLGDPADLSSASSVGTPTIGQKHALTATAPTIASTVGTPAITQVHALGDPADISSASTVGTPTLAGGAGLEGDGLDSASSVGTPTLAQKHALVATGLAATSEVGAGRAFSGVFTFDASEALTVPAEVREMTVEEEPREMVVAADPNAMTT